jgi:hypothetical protein
MNGIWNNTMNEFLLLKLNAAIEGTIDNAIDDLFAVD